MEADLNIIKRRYGDDLMHVCRENLGKVLEVDGLLPRLLDKYFYTYRGLGADIIKQGKQEDFISFILIKANIKDEDVYVDVGKSAQELFDESGYILYPECQTEEDIQSFRHFYKRDDGVVPVYQQGFMPLLDNGEELCTFRGGRLETCRVWFAVKKNVNKIKREDFKNPERQDLYGTSVISLQFTKGERVRLSIKNRYNHIVNMPDNTFNNNLERINKGLTVAFEKDFGVRDNIKNGNFDLELDNYILASDGKYYPYNYEINNVYYCPNNIIIDTFNVKKLPNHQILVDYFIIDCKDKVIKTYDSKLIESFPETFGEIKMILPERNSVIKIVRFDDTEVIIKSNKKGQMVSLEDKNLKNCGDFYLRNNKYLKRLIMPSLESCGKDFLRLNSGLEIIILSNLKKCGDAFMCYSKNTQKINLPNLLISGNDFMRYNQNLTEISLPKLKFCGDSFLYFNGSLLEINLPELCECGECFMYYNMLLNMLSMPNLHSCGNYFMEKNVTMQELSLPELHECGDNFFLSSPLKIINIPLVRSIGKYSFMKLNSERIKKSCVSEILKQYIFNREYWIPRGISPSALKGYNVTYGKNELRFKGKKEQDINCLKTALI